MADANELINILDILLEGILIVQDDHVVYSNEASCRLLGLDRNALMTQPIERFSYLDTALNNESNTWQATAISEKKIILLNTSHCRWNQKTAVLYQFRDHETNYPETELESEVYKRTQILHDALAQYRQSGRSLKGAKELAEQANQGKNQFLRMVGHEFNSPLNSILGFADLLKYDIPGTQKNWHSSLDEIIVAARRLHESIRDIHFVANLELGLIPTEKSAVEIAALLDSCITSLPRHDIAIHHKVSDALACTADANHLRKVFNILLENALRYNREGGELHVTAQVFDHTVRISFTDSGRGIAKKHLPNIFLPFQRQMGRHPNSKGVGLAMAKALCQAMGIEIGVYSELGKGSTFWVELPLISQESTIESQLDLSDKISVLYIDDQLPNLKLFKSLCEKLGDFIVYTNQDPDQGLPMARKLIPDVILLDLQMPELDGYQLASEMKQDPGLCDIPIIAVSAGPLMLDDRFDDFLHKPIDPKRLKRLLLQYGNRKHEHQ